MTPIPTGDLIGVIDIGKTNAKLLLVEADSGTVLWSIERRSTPVSRGNLRELPIVDIEQWLMSALASAPHKERIQALVPVAHGAAVVLISRDGKALAAPDYEDALFDEVADEYRPLRDPFATTLSPFLPAGLNLGRQLFYLQRRHRQLWDSTSALLLYPQYWAWKLSDVMSSEVTSLGCHSDLWAPLASRFSSLADAQGWTSLFPPLRAAGDVLGLISNAVGERTGLPATCRVLCGIHDSNASYLCHLASRPSGEPFAVISSGTWTVIMVHHGDLTRLREDRGMLANVDAFGAPIATARFMGGRDYEATTGSIQAARAPTSSSVERILRAQAFAIPELLHTASSAGWSHGQLLNAEGLDDLGRGALATLYSALRADLLLDEMGASGAVIVDGPLAANPLYGALLAAFKPRTSVLLDGDRAGSISCARYLCGIHSAATTRVAEPARMTDLAGYREAWRGKVASMAPL